MNFFLPKSCVKEKLQLSLHMQVSAKSQTEVVFCSKLLVLFCDIYLCLCCDTHIKLCSSKANHALICLSIVVFLKTMDGNVKH